MAGHPGELNEYRAESPVERPRRSWLPWIVTLVALTFLFGMIASPWVEREVRSRLPLGATPDAHRAAPAGQAQAQAAEADVHQRLHTPEERPPVPPRDEKPTPTTDHAQRLTALAN